MLHTQTVTADTMALIQDLMQEPELATFSLAGGTALSLQIGHRMSIDIDLFTNNAFDTVRMAKLLTEQYGADDVQVSKIGVFCFINDIKVDLVNHHYPWLKPAETSEGIRLVSIEEIGAMKLHAIVQSGQRLKDFVDVYTMLEHRSLENLYDAYEEKYKPDASSKIARGALNYHDEIDFKVTLALIDRKFDWPSIQSRLRIAMESPQKKFVKPTMQNKQEETQRKKRRGHRL